MNPPVNPRRPRIFIIGGGISGLAAAHRVVEESQRRKALVDLRLFESSDRLGGVIHTVQQEGFLLEGGPDSFITEKPWGLELCRRIGIEPQLIGTNENHRRTFIVREGRLLPVPDGFYLMAPTRIWPVVCYSDFQLDRENSHGGGYDFCLEGRQPMEDRTRALPTLYAGDWDAKLSKEWRSH